VPNEDEELLLGVVTKKKIKSQKPFGKKKKRGGGGVPLNCFFERPFSGGNPLLLSNTREKKPSQRGGKKARKKQRNVSKTNPLSVRRTPRLKKRNPPLCIVEKRKRVAGSKLSDYDHSAQTFSAPRPAKEKPNPCLKGGRKDTGSLKRRLTLRRGRVPGLIKKGKDQSYDVPKKKRETKAGKKSGQDRQSIITHRSRRRPSRCGKEKGN